jgi:hypothetical protein
MATTSALAVICAAFSAATVAISIDHQQLNNDNNGICSCCCCAG